MIDPREMYGPLPDGMDPELAMGALPSALQDEIDKFAVRLGEHIKNPRARTLWRGQPNFVRRSMVSHFLITCALSRVPHEAAGHMVELFLTGEEPEGDSCES